MIHEVLVVDDEKTIRDLICEQLNGEGYICDIATNAKEALNKMESHYFDVALLDIRLPGKSESN